MAFEKGQIYGGANAQREHIPASASSFQIHSPSTSTCSLFNHDVRLFTCTPATYVQGVYSSKNTLARHRRNHDTSKNHVCDTCNRVFRRADILPRHKLIHRTEATSPERVYKSRRAQAAFACEPCRHSKTKCDGQSPCNRCVRQDRPCQYKQNPKFQLSSEARDTGEIKSQHPSPVEPNSSLLRDFFEDAFLKGGPLEQANGTRAQNTTSDIPVSSDRKRLGGLQEDQSILAAALLSHHVTRLRFHAPLRYFYCIPIDNSAAQQADESVIDAAKRWAGDSSARLAVAHACSVYEVAREAARQG